MELGDDHALVIRMPRTDAQYQAIQLADLWFASMEHGNQVSSLTSEQSTRAPDDAYHDVTSNNDPGYANWLAAGPLRRGLFLIRWDGVQGALEPKKFSSGELVPIADLPETIPGFTVVDEAERDTTRGARRRHLQFRTHR